MIPVRLSLVAPRMLMGVPRRLGLCFWTITAGLVLGMRQYWLVPIALALHGLLSVACHRDPYFLDVLFRELGQPRRLDP